MVDEDIVTRPSEATPYSPADPVEAPAVTGRAADTPQENSTFGSRAKAVQADSTENKSARKRAKSK